MASKPTVRTFTARTGSSAGTGLEQACNRTQANKTRLAGQEVGKFMVLMDAEEGENPYQAPYPRDRRKQ
jgi:hypothetical protein